jgi:hypothetical protein
MTWPDTASLVGGGQTRAESSAADGLKLTEADWLSIERAAPKGAAKGERYPAQAKVHLDSESRG